MTTPSFQLFNRDGQASMGELQRLAARVEQRDRAAVGAPYEGGSSLELLESAAGPVTSILPPETLWAQLTAYDQTTGLYTWVWAVEQLDGTFKVNKARGGGPPSNYPAVDPNGLIYPKGVFVRLQPSQGGPYYRILAPGVGTSTIGLGGGSPRLLVTGIFSQTQASAGLPVVVVYTAVLLAWDPPTQTLVQTANAVLVFEPNGGYLVLGQAYAADFVALIPLPAPAAAAPLYVTDNERIFGPSGPLSSQGLVPPPGPIRGQQIVTGLTTNVLITPGVNTLTTVILSGISPSGDSWSLSAGSVILVDSPPNQEAVVISAVDPIAGTITATFTSVHAAGVPLGVLDIFVLRYLREDGQWAVPPITGGGGGGGGGSVTVLVVRVGDLDTSSDPTNLPPVYQGTVYQLNTATLTLLGVDVCYIVALRPQTQSPLANPFVTLTKNDNHIEFKFAGVYAGSQGPRALYVVTEVGDTGSNDSYSALLRWRGIINLETQYLGGGLKAADSFMVPATLGVIDTGMILTAEANPNLLAGVVGMLTIKDGRSFDSECQFGASSAFFHFTPEDTVSFFFASGWIHCSQGFGIWDGTNRSDGVRSIVFSAISADDGHLHELEIKGGIVVSDTDFGLAGGTADLQVVTGCKGGNIQTATIHWKNGNFLNVTVP